LFVFALLAGTPVLAAQAEMDLLASYLGKWDGGGVLVGGEKPQPFRCRMTMAKGGQLKINYSGRCSLVNMNLSVAGTIAYNDSTGRYEAAMSSNAGFTGYAVGMKHDDRITFDLQRQQKDNRGQNVRIGARISLGQGSITVDYEVEFNNSGQIMRATVPFSRASAS
jgi:hypothetical protein